MTNKETYIKLCAQGKAVPVFEKPWWLDIVCGDWWADPPVAVGLGATPDRALAALEEAVEQCGHPGDRSCPVPVGFVCEFCGQVVKSS